MTPKKVITLLFCVISFWGSAIVLGQDKLKWDNSALDGAGMPGLKYQAVSFFKGNYLFKGALDVIPYQNNRDEAELLILGHRGKIWSVPAHGLEDSVERHLVTDIKLHFKDMGQGKSSKHFQLLSGVLDRDWPQIPHLYLAVHQQDGLDGRCLIVRYKVGMESGFSLKGKAEIVYTWKSITHNGCDLHWGPKDGFLYISAGDGSVQRDPGKVGQQVDVVRGSILRLDVHSKPEPGRNYTVPGDNPFVGMDGVLPEIWAYGLRNPWRMCFHPVSEELWAADNGEDLWEMLYCVKRGSNAGWSSYEGHQPFHRDLALGGPNTQHTLPRLAQPHTELRSIIGGVFYRGKKFPELAGHYIYGCSITREIWAVAYDAHKDTLGKPFRIAKITYGTLTSICEDHQQELLLLSLSGSIETLSRREGEQKTRPWPKTLSDTGLFNHVASQKPSKGVLEYKVQAEAWADGASARRFLALPKSQITKIGNNRYYSSLRINEGGALVKTFYLDGAPVETQVLYNSGTWQGYTYKWDSKGKTASLVPEEGETAEIKRDSGKTQSWRYPSRSECMICHTQHSLFGIAFTAPQLNRTDPQGLQQLDEWLKTKVLKNNNDLKKRREVKLADPYNPKSGTLEERARAYLHINCAHCHHKTGMGGRAAMELEYHVPLAETGLIGGVPKIGLLGKAEAKLIVPGNAELSELLGRMNRRGAGQMPLFGSHEIDEAGVALIRDWINSLPKCEPPKNFDKNKVHP
ncbi:PQQ-dependent sugar dehydrogenase [Lentisphaera marina]|uniref:PQQ-dependent sugar dehydrogenase n=1 Tax=Lentisphaera marina TaxID=1111041 RepID=UPI002365E14A|nr:PQQ-dependent sugar dehydrogenase [Lentisphaera marina]MDD7985068.1 PQQ-dependent sugar dehydrogenase [Lentisphaera marina]